ncbi:YdcF family protein [Comamonas testosteroni]|uniref:YdcF family protein n=1 Tax=Comamonas testosteroni TaxID=285 RepID=A0A373FS88_COMTE|nr:YdcF family protein [Comamonas testosteroni]RGE47033.1 YdcF family protein [Comamonas testosteroni]
MKSEANSNSASKLARVLLVAVGGLLLIDALVLMAMGHFNVGVLLPAAMGAAVLLLSWKWRAVQRWRAAKPLHARLWSLGWVGLFVWLFSLLWFWSRLFSLGLEPQQVPQVQAIVVLGSGTLNGQPRPVLAARLDTAAELAKLQPKALIAVCGGIDWGETESEAEVMARYLEHRHGIAPERLVLEKLSTSTELNLKLSRPFLLERGMAADAPWAMVSSDFHLMRAMDMAKRQQLPNVYPVAAPTPLATRFNAWLREYFAMASSWVLGEV